MRHLFPGLVFGLFVTAALFGQLTPAYTLHGAAADTFGYHVAVIGDVNADGRVDFAVGAGGDDTNGVDAGAVHVCSGLDGSVLFSLYGNGPGIQLGSAPIAAAGDVDLDGVPDLIVGSQLESNSAPGAGAAHVFSGFDGSIIYTFNGSITNAFFGGAVDGAGDVNGDGYPDLIVGASSAWVNGADSGRARVFSGFDGSTLYTFNGASAYDGLGVSVGGLGDVNADGHDDVAVGIFKGDGVITDCGVVRVYSGVNGSILYEVYGSAAGNHFARSLAGGGDLNGDGVPDLLVGAKNNGENGVLAGKIYAYSGGDGSLLYSRLGDHIGDQLGTALSFAGDMDGDGHDDFVAGAPYDDAGFANNGSARAYSGSDGSTIGTVTGSGAGDLFGLTVSGGGDMDGDGFDDLIVGAPLDDDFGISSGSATVFLAPTYPALKYHTDTGFPHGIDLDWLPDGGDPNSVTGTLACSGATPGGLGLYGVSLARIDYLVFGYLPLLIADDPINLLQSGNFGFDLLGELSVPNVTRQHGFLAGSLVHIQFFETSPIIASSPGVRLLLVP